MKVMFNCCTKPALFTHNAGMTLFKGEKPEVETKAQIQPQIAQDKVEISAKKPEEKVECKDCK